MKNIGTMMKLRGGNFTIDMRSLKEEDPLAFAYGFVSALTGNELEKEDAAGSYIDGWYQGQRVRAGEEEMPHWVKEIK